MRCKEKGESEVKEKVYGEVVGASTLAAPAASGVQS